MKRAAAALVSTAAGFGVVLGLHAATLPASAAGPSTRPTTPTTGSAPGPTGATHASSGTGGATGGNPGTSSPPTVAPSTGALASAVGTAEQYGYGVLSVKVSARGHHIVDISLANIQVAESYSQMLAQQVVPMLRQEVLQAQSAQVNGISGATYTSEAYLYSVQSALDKLHV